ncbi:MAG TPA: toll/interleukin-1 receptor domain-containing protein [Caldimonas sp.]|nr:toll/interleukin-1 receptor domain-containing protein [Caldimonas sp.]
MARGDVFVSYCTKSDQGAAYELVSRVEAHGIECWIAPRDVQGGSEWAAEIVNAITVCKVMVLVFSPSANTSRDVRREVMLATQRGARILPFRIADIAPVASLEYFLAGHQWLDAFPPPMEPHYVRLYSCLNALLAAPVNPALPAGDAAAALAGLRGGAPHSPLGLEPASLHRLESALAVYIGPFAQIAVFRAAASAPSIDALLQALGAQIDSEADRRKFVSACQWLRSPH